MDECKRKLKGSEKRDIFKWAHKQLGNGLYATDADLCLVSKDPPGTVAYLDFKGSGEGITFAEVIQYNQWMRQAPVFIIEGRDPEHGPFAVKRYLGGDWRPHPPMVNLEHELDVSNWLELGQWERELRAEYYQKRGWGRLKGAEEHGG